MRYYLAIDMGASSGRHMLGHMQDGKLILEEIYRFKNETIERNGSLVWDADGLFAHILKGMRRCGELDKIPVSVSVDTWGVDFVLLDDAGDRLGEAVAYRDSRTQGADALVEERLPFPALYRRTGIQKMILNTIYQLTALKRDDPGLLDRAQRLLMSPDYYHYLLTGRAVNEYTIATTSSLVDAEAKTWDRELIDLLGLPQKIFGDLIPPGNMIGTLRPEIAQQIGYSCQVVLPPSHDTASAYLAVPAADDNSVYLSSGTWSLMGIESTAPIITEFGRKSDLTNEGGYDYRFRYLKNIMGLWMLQSVRKETGEQYSFPNLAKLAAKSGAPVAIVPVNHSAFLAPESMVGAVKMVCRETGQTVPETLGQVLQCIYYSLAQCYGDTVRELEEITGRTFTSINIVGGGSQDAYLNALTARVTGRPVYAGPVEATVIGNLMAQMIAAGEIRDLTAGRQIVRGSFAVTEVRPK